MRRKSFDALVSAAGLVVAAVLLVASGLLFWAHSFVDNQVSTQLTAQKIFMPTAGSDSLNDPAVKPYLTRYAGQQVVNGPQAKAFADHYIAVHLKAIGGGLTYSELSAKARANPADTKTADAVQTVFRGETLRGLLLNAYAFWTIGSIAFVAAWVAGTAGLIFVALGILGLWHARRTPYDVKVSIPGWHPENVSTG